MLDIKVPSPGESVTEATITEWLKSEGDAVKIDDTLAVLETDKASVDVVAPASGVLRSISKKAGEVVSVGAVIAQLDESVAASSGAKSPQPKVPQAKVPAAPSAPAKPVASVPPAPQVNEVSSPTSSSMNGTRESPSTRRAHREGRVVDVPAIPKARTVSSAPVTTSLQEGERAVPMTPLRKTIAHRLVEAQQSAALLTTFNEIDMTNVMALRAEFKDSFQERHGTKLGFMSFFVKAVVEALHDFPAINAEIRGDSIIYKDFYDIGVAVGSGRGLVVPILRDADRLSFAEVEKQIADLGKRAQENKIRLDELQGGTFTISNGGVYGSLLSTPIVNPPQSGILGMHAIQDRPMAVQGKIEIRKMMYVALTYDHRIVDGREAVGFLVRVKQCIENPSRLLLNA